jgi:hypothetical protein
VEKSVLAGFWGAKGKITLMLAGFLLAWPLLGQARAQYFSPLFQQDDQESLPKPKIHKTPPPVAPSIPLKGSASQDESKPLQAISSPSDLQGQDQGFEASSLKPSSSAKAQVQGPIKGMIDLLSLRGAQAPLYDPSASARLGDPLSPPGAGLQSQRRKKPLEDEDYYKPLGLQRGAFILRPSIEAALGADTNANQTPVNIRSSAYSRIAPEFEVESNWSRHRLDLKFGLERFDYFSGNLDPRTNVNFAAKGRVDIRRGTELDLGADYKIDSDNSAINTSLLPGNAAGRPSVTTLGANMALLQAIGRLGLRLSGSVDERTFGSTPLESGAVISNSERDVRDTLVGLRSSYEWTPAFKPFVETLVNAHDYDTPVDAGGFKKGSDGVTLRSGAMFDSGALFKGEIAIGVIHQMPYEPTAAAYTGLTFDGNLAWMPTPLTTLRIAANTSVLDDALVGAIGGLSHDFTFTAEHALRRNVTLSGTMGFGIDNYQRIVRNDDRLSGELKAAWKLNRNAELQTRIKHESLFSSVPGQDVEDTIYETGIKLQY